MLGLRERLWVRRLEVGEYGGERGREREGGCDPEREEDEDGVEDRIRCRDGEGDREGEVGLGSESMDAEDVLLRRPRRGDIPSSAEESCLPRATEEDVPTGQKTNEKVGRPHD